MISDRNRPLLEELELGDIAGDLSMGSGVRLKAVWGEYSADGGDAPAQKRFETPEGDPAAAAALREKVRICIPERHGNGGGEAHRYRDSERTAAS